MDFRGVDYSRSFTFNPDIVPGEFKVRPEDICLTDRYLSHPGGEVLLFLTGAGPVIFVWSARGLDPDDQISRVPLLIRHVANRRAGVHGVGDLKGELAEQFLEAHMPVGTVIVRDATDAVLTTLLEAEIVHKPSGSGRIRPED